MSGTCPAVSEGNATPEVLVTFEIRKTKAKPYGKIVVLAPCPAHPRHYGIYFSIGDQPRGFTPIYAGVVFGKTVPYRPVIGCASRMARAFARQQKCRWVYRPDRPKPFRKVEL